jgi:integrase/recombinase XerD
MGRDQGDPIMLDTLLELPFALNRHRDAPLLEERLAFLKYLQEQGTSRTALRSVSGQLLHVIDLLKLETLRDISVGEVKQAARRWGEQQRTNARARTYVRTEIYFEYAAKKWLRFADRLKSPLTPVKWFTDHLQDFARWMTEEQGLSPLSVRSHCWKASTFLSWFAEWHTCLSRVRLQDVDEFLTLKGQCSWNRTSVSVAASHRQVTFGLLPDVIR